MVSVSAMIYVVARVVVARVVRVGDWFSRHAIGSIRPSSEILQSAAFAAERPPGVIHTMPPAEHAQFYLRRLIEFRHPAVCNCRILYRYRDGVLSPAWWRTSRAETMKITSSAMFVAWSPMRSRWR